MVKLLEVGTVEKKSNLEETEFEWKIADFYSPFKKEFYTTPIFSFGGAIWNISISRSYTEVDDIFKCYLYNDVLPEYSVEYNFCIVKQDGRMVPLIKGILDVNQSEYLRHEGKFVALHDLQLRKPELAPSGIHAIRGTLKHRTVPLQDKQKLENLIKLDTLSDHFTKLFVNKDNCDTTLHVMNKEFKAHRAVLIARSSVFAAMFQHNTSEKQTGIITIPDCDPESFDEFLGFLYSGKLKKPSPCSVLHLFETSEKYNVQELKAFCMEYLMENLTVDILYDVVIIADKYDEGNLQSAAQDFFNKNFSEILDTPDWDSMVRNNYHLSKKLLKEFSKKKFIN